MRLVDQAVPRPRVCPPAGVSGADRQGGRGENHLRCSALGGVKAQGPGIPWPYPCPHGQERLGRVARLPGAYRDPAIDMVAMKLWDLPTRFLCQDLHMPPVTLG